MLFSIAAGSVGFLAGAIFVWVRMKLRWHDALRAARTQSVNQSRSTLKGQIGEQLAPLLPGFNYPPADARFLGDPIDYVVFNGYTAIKDGDAIDPNDLEIVILDIKHGRSQLSETQRAIAAAVGAGRVRFEVVRISESGKVSRVGT